ncbi:MAG: hypothetical protein JNJ49_14485 [Bdellovibrionaceae bacterium]|nr:hypothetical protein [Pseudobdellovibrionaceae bacterium]
MRITAVFHFAVRLFLLFSCSIGLSAHAEGPVFNGFEKIAVFPVLLEGASGLGGGVDDATAKSLDEVWWQVREELTSTGRFVVASRAFLQRVDAFQPRGVLTTADAVILSRHVEAEVLITVRLKVRSLTVAVWEGKDGSKLWEESVELHPSVLVRDQVGAVGKSLVRRFIAHLPFQGITQLDPLTRQPIYEDGGRRLVKVKTGLGARIAEGDVAQWLQVRRSSLDPLLQGGAKTEITAVGKVVSVKDQIATVELTRIADSRGVQVGGLVAFPSEIERLNVKSDDKARVSELAMQILQPAQRSVDEESKKETRPLATTLSILASIAAVLLLAF